MTFLSGTDASATLEQIVAGYRARPRATCNRHRPPSVELHDLGHGPENAAAAGAFCEWSSVSTETKTAPAELSDRSGDPLLDHAVRLQPLNALPARRGRQPHQVAIRRPGGRRPVATGRGSCGDGVMGTRCLEINAILASSIEYLSVYRSFSDISRKIFYGWIFLPGSRPLTAQPSSRSCRGQSALDHSGAAVRRKVEPARFLCAARPVPSKSCRALRANLRRLGRKLAASNSDYGRGKPHLTEDFAAVPDRRRPAAQSAAEWVPDAAVRWGRRILDDNPARLYGSRRQPRWRRFRNAPARVGSLRRRHSTNGFH